MTASHSAGTAAAAAEQSAVSTASRYRHSLWRKKRRVLLSSLFRRLGTGAGNRRVWFWRLCTASRLLGVALEGQPFRRLVGQSVCWERLASSGIKVKEKVSESGRR